MGAFATAVPQWPPPLAMEEPPDRPAAAAAVPPARSADRSASKSQQLSKGHSDDAVGAAAGAPGSNAETAACVQSLHPVTVQEMLGPDTFQKLRGLLLEQQHEYRCQLHMYQWLLLQHSVHQGQLSSAGSGSGKLESDQETQRSGGSEPAGGKASNGTSACDAKGSGDVGGTSGQGSNDQTKAAKTGSAEAPEAERRGAGAVLQSAVDAKASDKTSAPAPEGGSNSSGVEEHQGSNPEDGAERKRSQSPSSHAIQPPSCKRSCVAGGAPPHAAATPAAHQPAGPSCAAAVPLSALATQASAALPSTTRSAAPATRCSKRPADCAAAAPVDPPSAEGSAAPLAGQGSADAATGSGDRTGPGSLRFPDDASAALDASRAEGREAKRRCTGATQPPAADRSVVATNTKARARSALDGPRSAAQDVPRKALKAVATNSGSNWPVQGAGAAAAAAADAAEEAEFSDSGGESDAGRGGGGGRVGDNKPGNGLSVVTPGDNSANEQNSGCQGGLALLARDPSVSNLDQNFLAAVQAEAARCSAAAALPAARAPPPPAGGSGRGGSCPGEAGPAADAEADAAAGAAAQRGGHPFSQLPGYMNPVHATPMDTWMACAMPMLGQPSGSDGPGRTHSQPPPSQSLYSASALARLQQPVDYQQRAPTAPYGHMWQPGMQPMQAHGMALWMQPCVQPGMPFGGQQQQQQQRGGPMDRYLAMQQMSDAQLYATPTPFGAPSSAQAHETLDWQQAQIVQAQAQLDLRQQVLLRQQQRIAQRDAALAAPQGQQQHAPVPQASAQPCAAAGAAKAAAATAAAVQPGSAFTKCDGVMAPDNAVPCPLTVRGITYPQMQQGTRAAPPAGPYASPVAQLMRRGSSAHAHAGALANSALAPDPHAVAASAHAAAAAAAAAHPATLDAGEGAGEHCASAGGNASAAAASGAVGTANASGNAAAANPRLAVSSHLSRADPALAQPSPFAHAARAAAHAHAAPGSALEASTPAAVGAVAPLQQPPRYPDPVMWPHGGAVLPPAAVVPPRTHTADYSNLLNTSVPVPPQGEAPDAADPVSRSKATSGSGRATEMELSGRLLPQLQQNASDGSGGSQGPPTPSERSRAPTGGGASALQPASQTPPGSSGSHGGGSGARSGAPSHGTAHPSYAAPWGIDAELLDWLQKLLPQPRALDHSDASPQASWASEQVIALLANPTMLRAGASFKEATAVNLQQIIAIRDMHSRLLSAGDQRAAPEEQRSQGACSGRGGPAPTALAAAAAQQLFGLPVLAAPSQRRPSPSSAHLGASVGPGWDSRVLEGAPATLPPGAWVNPEPSYGSPQPTDGPTGGSAGLPTSDAPQSGITQRARADISSRGAASGGADAMECA